MRPPSSYTSALKIEQMASERLPGLPSDYEEDHRLPLELGGAAADVYNLSPESHVTSYSKDKDENAYHSFVCSAGRDLRATQIAFIQKWLAAYPGYRSVP